MFEFLVHRVKVVSDELNAASERVGALTQYLDGFLHELDILLGETACRAHARSFVGCLIPIGRCICLFITCGLFSGYLLLSAFSQTAHLNLRTGSFLLSRRVLVAVGHQTLGFLNEGTAAAHVVLVIAATKLLLGHIVVSRITHGSLLLEVHLLFTLLSHHILMLCTHLFVLHPLALLLLVFGALSLLFFCLPLFVLFAFLVLGPPALLLFLLLVAHTLFLLSLGLRRLFGLCLSASLLLSGSRLSTAIILCLLGSSCFVPAADYLGDIRRTVDIRGGSAELHLEVRISVLRLLASEDHRRLNVKLLSVHHLSESDGLDEPGQFLLFVGQRLRFQLVSLVQTLPVASFFHRRSEDIV